MRPRVFPAEDMITQQEEVGDATPSMRPRVFPAEDSGPRGSRVSGSSLQ